MNTETSNAPLSH